MPSDLERFLQQAADRLAQQAGAPKQAPPAKPRTRPSRQQERQRLEPEIIDAEIIDSAEEARAANRRLGPNPLSDIDTRPELAVEISQADEKMARHIHAALDHEDHNFIAGKQKSLVGSEVQVREMEVSPLIKMLRDPSTLRQAFIASEVFSRKF